VHYVTQLPFHSDRGCFTQNSSFLLYEQLLLPFSGVFFFPEDAEVVPVQQDGRMFEVTQ
jgi:hypothetical protein